MLSADGCKGTAMVYQNGAISDDELASLLRSALHCSSAQADVFTYGGRTLVIACPAPPLRSRFSTVLRIRRAKKN